MVTPRPFGFCNGDLARVSTEIGLLRHPRLGDGGRDTARRRRPVRINLGRWRLKRGGRKQQTAGHRRWLTLKNSATGAWRLRSSKASSRLRAPMRDSQRIFWKEGGVHQQFDLRGSSRPGERHAGLLASEGGGRAGTAGRPLYGDVMGDTNRSHESYRQCCALARSAPVLRACAGPCGSRARSDPIRQNSK